MSGRKIRCQVLRKKSKGVGFLKEDPKKKCRFLSPRREKKKKAGKKHKDLIQLFMVQYLENDIFFCQQIKKPPNQFPNSAVLAIPFPHYGQ